MGKTKIAVAVCRTRSTDLGDNVILVAAGHAKSDGTDNRALVAALKQLACSRGWALLIGMDANSAASADLAKGAASQETFFDFLEKTDVFHSFGALPYRKEALKDHDQFHTVRKCRGYIQCQLHKANRPDLSAKDFVLSSNNDYMRFKKTCRVNKAAWLDVAGNRAILPDETETWDRDKDMPNTEFVSDHALVLTDIEVVTKVVTNETSQINEAHGSCSCNDGSCCYVNINIVARAITDLLRSSRIRQTPSVS